jgi:hypothetical protein
MTAPLTLVLQVSGSNASKNYSLSLIFPDGIFQYDIILTVDLSPFISSTSQNKEITGEGREAAW